MDLNGPEADQFCAWEAGHHIGYECAPVVVAVENLSKIKDNAKVKTEKLQTKILERTAWV